MPNAKVGAMPNPSGNNPSNRKGRRGEEAKAGGRKGITIEDLKSQTAQRLAKQQQSRQRKQIRGNLQPKLARQPDGPSAYQQQPHSTTRAPNFSHGQIPLQSFQQVASFESEYSVSSQASLDVSSHNLANGGSVPNTPSRGVHAPVHHRPNDYHASHASAHKNHESKGHSRSHHKKSPYAQLKVQNVSKLPQTLSHGLTVQELKEMTRARLATEATSDGSGSVGVNDAIEHQYIPRQRVYSQESNRSNRSDVIPRQRIDSAESYRSAPASYATQSSSFSFRNPFAKSRSSSRLQQPGISTFGSMDAGDNASVNSYVSGHGGESYVGSDASGFYASATASCGARDLGRSVSFPVGECPGETESELYGHFMASASFETGTRRLAAGGLPSPALSNLMEDKPFHSEIGTSFSGEGQRFDFGGLPASPAVHNKSFSEETLSELLPNKRPITPSTVQSVTFSDSHTTNDEALHIAAPMPDLKPSILGAQSVRGGELSKTVAESVLGGELLQEHPPFLKDGQDACNPWKQSNDGGFSKLESDLNNLLLSENNTENVDDFPFSSFRSKASAKKQFDWTSTSVGLHAGNPVEESSNPSIAECFNDDGSSLPSSRKSDEDASKLSSPAKSVNKKRNTSRWKFM